MSFKLLPFTWTFVLQTLNSSKIAFRVKKPVFGRERKNGPFNKIKQNFARIWKVFQDVKTNPNKIGCFCP